MDETKDRAGIENGNSSRGCVFCGNPAEIVDEIFPWLSYCNVCYERAEIHRGRIAEGFHEDEPVL